MYGYCRAGVFRLETMPSYEGSEERYSAEVTYLERLRDFVSKHCAIIILFLAGLPEIYI